MTKFGPNGWLMQLQPLCLIKHNIFVILYICDVFNGERSLLLLPFLIFKGRVVIRNRAILRYNMVIYCDHSVFFVMLIVCTLDI